MKLNIHAGMRVLYKHNNNNNWSIGQLRPGAAIIDKDGLFLYVYTKEGIEHGVSNGDRDEDQYMVSVNANDIFFDAQPLEDWMKEYCLMTKEDYIGVIERDDEKFVKALEQVYVSDGEYYYYPITKFTKTWIEKQPFDYVVKFNP